MSYPALGLSDVLCLPAKKKDFSDTTVLSHFRRVAYVEDFYDILHKKFVSLCPLCSSQKLQHNQAAEALHSFRIHEQRPSGCTYLYFSKVDLIDMRHPL
eukprot:Em0002g540a